ncbi:MAG: hypothetical protein ACXVRS_00630 [Gaiellaceae bacterium]
MAQALEISPRTASRWKKNPLVIAEVERIRNRSDQQRAAEILVRLTESDDERVALRACELVLQRSIRRTAREPEPPGDEAAPAAAAVVLRIEKGAEITETITIEDGEIVG